MTIQKYINGAFEELKVEISNGVEKDRKEDILEQVQAWFYNLKQSIESGTELPRDVYFEIEDQNKKYASLLMDLLKDKIKDVQSRQNNILDARNYLQRQIDELNEQVFNIIQQFVKKNEENVEGLLKNDDSEIEEMISREYKKIINQHSKRDIFREELKKGAPPLNKQNNNAAEFNRNAEATKPGTEKLANETLPPSLL